MRSIHQHNTIILIIVCISLLWYPVISYGDEDVQIDVIAALEKSLAFYAERQYKGGWASHYSLDLTRQWGEWRPTHPNVVTINDSGTTGIALIFIKAAQVLEDPQWLEVARKTGDLLVAGQLPHGGYPQELQITPDGINGVHQLKPYPEAPRSAEEGVLENNTTDRAIALLLALYDATGDDNYFQAARKAVDFLMAAQYACGAFPQRYPPSKSYDRHYTFNDGATTDSVLRLISFHRRTGETKYLDAAIKGGEWILRAMLPEPTPGWAEQYDHDNTPAKARAFEPPGVSTEITNMVIETLIELYLVTGDIKYLAPVEKAIQWLESTQVDGTDRCYRLYEAGTGKPIFVERHTGVIHYNINELPSDQHTRWYRNTFFSTLPSDPITPVERWQRLQHLGRMIFLEQRKARTGSLDIESGYDAFRTPVIESKDDQEALETRVQAILAAQEPAGWWRGECDGTPTIKSAAFTRNAVVLLTYLRAISSPQNSHCSK